MKQLFFFFDQIQPLSRSLRRYLRSCLRRVEFPKNHVILKEGRIAKAIYFIEEGIVRSYTTIDGKEKTLWFMKKHDFMVSVGSFFSQSPATESVQTVEPCVCWYITYEQLQEAYKKYRQFNLHRAVILEKYYEFSEKRNLMRLMPLFYRYEFLINKESWLVQEVPDVHLYSYLGMSKRSFGNQKTNYAKGIKPEGYQRSKKVQ